MLGYLLESDCSLGFEDWCFINYQIGLLDYKVMNEPSQVWKVIFQLPGLLGFLNWIFFAVPLDILELITLSRD